jgi:hypothetical protein
MNYNIILDVPAKYLGLEVTNLISKLAPKEAAEIRSLPVKAKING